MCKILKSITYLKDMKVIKKKYPQFISKIKQIELKIQNKDITKLTRNKILKDSRAKGCSECHVMFDLVIVYKYTLNDEVILAKVGKHDDVFKRDWNNRDNWLNY
ncbi:type II toxin-antitoxin system mRNA interferase toxin, RelE/StbE family [uncultured Clostridium sp.]|uniref:type II toxin-antitoxin system mRNA interferase toxin, RelE/StbE family n=1 Tax=uncultured Clostridium sp. TaxID=59620 RepID=UPI002638FE29|nr:type II toxin-antitoxin system mRNA interferase toxin, RelE/StbE family [uncultured Clostridium sp.]